MSFRSRRFRFVRRASVWAAIFDYRMRLEDVPVQRQRTYVPYVGADCIGHAVQFENGLVAERLNLAKRADKIEFRLVDPGLSLFKANLTKCGNDLFNRDCSALCKLSQGLANLLAWAETVETRIVAAALEHRADVITRVVVIKYEVGCEDKALKLSRITRIAHAEALQRSRDRLCLKGGIAAG